MRHDDLGGGLAGTALYEMVAAHTRGTWTSARAAAQAITAQPLAGNPEEASLYRGVPAVAYTLHFAKPSASSRTLARLDAETIAIVAARLSAAQRRMDSGRPPRMAEYDLISGLTGLGAYLLQRGRQTALERILHYLVRLLTEPLTVAGNQVPGWWTTDGPRGLPEDGPFSTGHANFGIAHGMPGPLALLALASRAGIMVDGQERALDEGIAFLTTWAQRYSNGALGWPEILDLDDFLNGPVSGAEPGRPSWCYGTPGIGRALQLAALARRNGPARQFAEHLVLGSITDHRHLSQLEDTTICHGWAGLLLTCDRIAADAMTPRIANELPVLRSHLSTHLVRHEIPSTAGLLSGNAGVLLTLHTLDAPRPADLGWETCLLLN
ncbi:lanthionine synthetase C family protein [Streptomyces sp. NBC_00557]|uniref:lanthionine synthetase C family protein n=1 Tax=Streptomyces sp. NBC_00557 TaxID=2975776 RepID=UPI002E802165|nr:lanthionine synthetase C family protein [Streptomyces sp. NBC_00557]WUC39637.1 lanthionine synthetase C family protein [Streptomyces sp. NBC_00557]